MPNIASLEHLISSLKQRRFSCNLAASRIGSTLSFLHLPFAYHAHNKRAPSKKGDSTSFFSVTICITPHALGCALIRKEAFRACWSVQVPVRCEQRSRAVLMMRSMHWFGRYNVLCHHHQTRKCRTIEFSYYLD